MTQTTNELAAPADGNFAAAYNTKPAAKTRRPRRMARESGDPGAAAVVGEGNTIPQPDEATPAAAKPAGTPRSDSKIARAIALLSREQGATLTELVEATGWLPHTTRAALTGLKKKGHVIAKTKRDGVTCYRIEEAA